MGIDKISNGIIAAETPVEPQRAMATLMQGLVLVDVSLVAFPAM